jgi:hypothetical protein
MRLERSRQSRTPLSGCSDGGTPPGKAVFDIEFVEEETGCRRADFGDRIDLLTDQGLHQPGRECGLLFRAVRSLRATDADKRHRLRVICGLSTMRSYRNPDFDRGRQ